MLSFEKPLVMAIVNLTPDSFYDGGKYSEVTDVLRDAEEKIKQGADIIDIGAASSRPNAKEIDEKEEWSRLEHGRRELVAVIRARGDDARVRRLRVEAVDEIDVAAARDSVEHGARRLRNFDLVPADLRNF